MMTYLQLLIAVLGLLLAACNSGNGKIKGRPEIQKYGTGEDVEEPEEGPPKVTRPNGQITINNPLCACAAKKPDIHTSTNCAAFCASTTNAEPILYGTVSVGPDIYLDENLENLYNWCYAPIEDGNTAPSCEIQLMTADGQVAPIDILINASTPNKFQANISSLTPGVAYSAKIVEKTSKSSSNPFQLIREMPKTAPELPSGAIPQIAVFEYKCIFRDTVYIGLDALFEDFVERHFYYPLNDKPFPAPPGISEAICHQGPMGQNDSVNYARLDMKHAFNMWYANSTLMQPVDNANSTTRINDYINKALRDKGVSVPSSIDFFLSFEFLWRPKFPDNKKESVILGYYLRPIEDTSGNIFCPNNEDFIQPDRPLLQVLKPFLTGGTEALYVAVRDAKMFNVRDPQGNPTGQQALAPDTWLLIPESTVKELWFYIDDDTQLKITPSTADLRNKTIHFYYPPKTAGDPKVQAAGQFGYTIVSKNDLPGGTGGNTYADKRIGCVPKFKNAP